MLCVAPRFPPQITMASLFGEPSGALRKGFTIRNGVICSDAEAATVAERPAAVATLSRAVANCGAGGESPAAAASGAAAAPKTYVKSTLSVDERFELCKSVGEECIKVKMRELCGWLRLCLLVSSVYPCVFLRRRRSSWPC